jgi:hypothetical protein
VKYEAKIVYFPGQPHPVDACGCQYCEQEWHNVMDDLDPDGWMRRLNRGMILCPECGNKRCPKASYHDHACSGSNDSGQPGSVYGGWELPNEPEVSDV